MIERRAARVLLVAGRTVLLIEGVDPGRPQDGSWWMTPGGGIDGGESAAEAAVREVFEETGLRLMVDQMGPVVASRVARFEFNGSRFRQRESFFAVQVERFTPRGLGWDDLERRSLLGHRWWHVDDLRTTGERVYPSELANLMQAVIDGTLTEPLTLSGL